MPLPRPFQGRLNTSVLADSLRSQATSGVLRQRRVRVIVKGTGRAVAPQKLPSLPGAGVFRDLPGLRGAIVGAGLVVQKQSTLAGAVTLTVDERDLGTLAALPGVESIWEDKPLSFLWLEEVNAVHVSSYRQYQGKGVWKGVTGKGVGVAVVDTGADVRHPGLKGAVTGFRDETGDGVGDSQGHGSHVSGIIAGRNPYVPGMAPEATIVGVRVLGPRGGGAVSDFLNGLDWVAQNARGVGVRVVNMSLGAPYPFCDGVPGSVWEDPLCTAVNNISDTVVPLVAAGNSGPKASTLSCPGKAVRGITVAAADVKGNLQYYSSRGGTSVLRAPVNKPDLMAVGGLPPTGPNHTYRAGEGYLSVKANTKSYKRMAGTSMATPQVAGAVALLLQHLGNPAITPAWTKWVKDTLMKTTQTGAQPLETGAGFIDMRKLAQMVEALRRK